MGVTAEPEEAGTPDGARIPDGSGKPDGGGVQDGSGKPKGTGIRDGAGNPDGTGRSEATGVRDGPGKPRLEEAATTESGASEEPQSQAAAPRSASVLRSGAVMAAGSVVSRATGFVRSAVVVAALGTAMTADGYTVANTVPNILYILLIGGALNAVFVPELVRAAKEHADRGVAYTDRLLTLCTVGLLALTALAVAAAP